MMLSLGGVSPPVALKRASLLFQGQTHKPQLSIYPETKFTPLLLGRNGLCLFAQKKQQSSSLGTIELEKEAIFEDDEDYEFDDEDDDFLDDEDEDFDEEESDENEDDELMIPFHKMDAWLERKPRGFGEGKVYDTSIEDKLLEEIEKAKEAQIANVNKLKNAKKEPISKTEIKKELTASEVVPSGIRVRISNLPKKKNIQRDLKSAFQGVRGILNISPALSGNKKTRDPVCKGFGFVDFKSLEDANRFVQTFSTQSITFGKTVKHIKCEILKPRDADIKGSPDNGYNNSSDSRLTVSEDEGDEDLEAELNDHTAQFSEDDDSDESDDEPDDLDMVHNFELLSASEQGGSDGAESLMKSKTNKSSSNHKEKTKANKKKSSVKKKPEKIPKLNIPGSAKKLKVQERAKLADVFSRYGSKAALATKEL